ncbi:MAG: hypothetical protein D6811_06965 [Alphaproteobacteria bacterium]|nr:MAG: hypothetical protein D6811_06965 [Alphaproteobacteria bacterium]
MSELSELEHRLSEALDRIRSGVERLAMVPAVAPASGGDADQAAEAAEEIAALREALEAERLANAQLEERVATIRGRLEERLKQLEAEAGELREQLEATQLRNRHLKRRLEEVRAALARLREAAAEGTSEPQLINQAILTELEALRALREADRQELDALIAELKPLVEEDANA